MTEGSGARSPEQNDRLRALGAAIRWHRWPATQVQLAERLGSPQSSVSAWENGRVDLTVEQVFAVERMLAVPPGRLLYLGGYVDPEARPARIREGLPPRKAQPFHAGPGAATFAGRVQRWLDQYRSLIEAICLLRETAADDEALEALLDSRPIKTLSLSWELWEEISLDPGQDPVAILGAVVGREDVVRCRYALWGESAPRSVVLRICKPVLP